MQLTAKKLILVLIVLALAFLPTVAQAYPPILFGAYYQPNEVSDMQAWLQFAGSPVGVSIAGDFVGLPTDPINLERITDYKERGFVPFVNIMPLGCTLTSIAQGDCDAEIDTLISVYLAFDGRAFLAPFPEANGSWVEYGLQPGAYKAAFRYMRNRFVAAGLGRNRILWVFAPNGWSQSGHEFEKYYPGGDIVDVVGFSAFNHGPQCGGPYQSYEQAVLPYLERMAALAPDKPIFLTQVGSLSNKGPWAADMLTKFAKFPGARAVIYFNTTTTECGGADYRITGASDVLIPLEKYGYWAAHNPAWDTAFRDTPQQTFADVLAVHPFTGTDFIEQIYQAGITGGCGVSPALYCPDSSVTRAQMAIFLLRVEHGAGFQPPAAVGVFADVPTDHWAAAWIEQLSHEGITGGCGVNPARYCPDSNVTRAQMAIFLLKTKYGASFWPAPAVGRFLDVPASHWAATWIERAVADGSIPPCAVSPARYCPESQVTRAQMAEYIFRLMQP